MIENCFLASFVEPFLLCVWFVWADVCVCVRCFSASSPCFKGEAGKSETRKKPNKNGPETSVPGP
jgi:hypothetical protein